MATTANQQQHHYGTINESATKKALPLFQVLGISLVVDQIGKGAQMVLRYPVGLDEQAEPPTEVGGADHELFFKMSPRIMAKLFRPKKSLCGQPMTLSVGGTVFCCRAVLLEHNDNTSDTAVDSTASTTSISSMASAATATNETKLVLFSVIVALAPSEPTKSIPISGWFEGDDDDVNGHYHPHYDHLHRNGHRAASSSARSIRRVHLSLARFCRALEREERRCRFVLGQSNHFFKIRSETNKEWEERMASATKGESSSSAPSNSNNPSSSGSVGQLTSPKGVVGGGGHASGNSSTVSTPDMGSRVTRHTRNLTATSLTTATTIGSLSVTSVGGGGSGGSVGGGGGGGGDGADQHPAMTSDNLMMMDKSQLQYQMEQEKEQEILERILASSPPAEYEKNHFGNLAREIVQVFHSLSRDDPRHSYPQTTHTPGMLSGRDSVVYVNGHIAVPIESAIAGLDSTMTAITDRLPMVRSYHTLLFPSLTASELVETLQLAAASPQQQSMQQLLFMLNPTRSLNEIAIESNVSLTAIIDMALQLIQQGVCVASPTITRTTRLACAHNAINIMQDLALEFGQTFSLGRGGNLFVVVSHLTFHSWTLGEALTSVSRSDNERAVFLRNQIQHFLRAQQQQQQTSQTVQQHPRRLLPTVDEASQHHLSSYSDILPTDAAAVTAGRHHADELEEVLFAMAIWLVSHRVIVRLEEYFVAMDAAFQDRRAPSSIELHLSETADSAEEKRGGVSTTYLPSYFGTIPDSVVDENLFKELKEAGCLDGTKSVTACAWKLGIEAHRLRMWAIRHDGVRIVERIPSPGDDWDVA